MIYNKINTRGTLDVHSEKLLKKKYGIIISILSEILEHNKEDYSYRC